MAAHSPRRIKKTRSRFRPWILLVALLIVTAVAAWVIGANKNLRSQASLTGHDSEIINRGDYFSTNIPRIDVATAGIEECPIPPSPTPAPASKTKTSQETIHPRVAGTRLAHQLGDLDELISVSCVAAADARLPRGYTPHIVEYGKYPDREQTWQKSKRPLGIQTSQTVYFDEQTLQGNTDGLSWDSGADMWYRKLAMPPDGVIYEEPINGGSGEEILSITCNSGDREYHQHPTDCFWPGGCAYGIIADLEPEDFYRDSLYGILDKAHVSAHFLSIYRQTSRWKVPGKPLEYALDHNARVTLDSARHELPPVRVSPPVYPAAFSEADAQKDVWYVIALNKLSAEDEKKLRDLGTERSLGGIPSALAKASLYDIENHELGHLGIYSANLNFYFDVMNKPYEIMKKQGVPESRIINLILWSDRIRQALVDELWAVWEKEQAWTKAYEQAERRIDPVQKGRFVMYKNGQAIKELKVTCYKKAINQVISQFAVKTGRSWTKKSGLWYEKL